MDQATGRHFLFLQGPHGPFVGRLARHLAGMGADVRRIAFNRADEAEWGDAGPMQRYLGPAYSYGAWLTQQIARNDITDIVLYGDSRPEHARAIIAARRLGLICHCLEEGYLRPHYVTYERWGSNGNSRLHQIPPEAIAAAIGRAAPPEGVPDDGWGAHRAHLWHSARYHGRLLLPQYPYAPPLRRRGIGLWREVANYTARLAGLLARRVWQGRAARRLLAEGRRYHLVMLQLSFDASMQAYSDYRSSARFVGDCIEAFAAGAPEGELLVFKSHPFEDGRERLARVIRRIAAERGIAERVVFLDGGIGLGQLLDGAASAVTINSTAGQQALGRGLPLAALGRAVYARPGLVSDQSLDAFFADPQPPDQQAYWQFRAFLTRTSQIPGSFYAPAGIARALAALPAVMLADRDPYDRLPAPHLVPEPALTEPALSEPALAEPALTEPTLRPHLAAL